MPHDSPPDSYPASEPKIPPEHSAPPVAPIQAAGPFQRVLPWALSAAAVLGLMLVMLFVVLPRVSQVPRHSRPSLPSGAAALPATDPDRPTPTLPLPPPAGAAPAGGAALPLAVTLYSAGSGKHIAVGKPILISAYASLPPSGSATIAISYTCDGGPRSLLTLAQGSLSTASWTPAAPGRYDFTASALDSRKISAFSHHIIINADAAPATAGPIPASIVSPAPPVKAAESVPALRREKPVLRRIAVRSLPAERPAPKLPTAKPVVKPVPAAKAPSSKVLHVAAAQFVVRPVAETLAGALRRRGFHAFVRVNTQPDRKPTYVVETGKFLRPADAKKQLYTLNHDGYPAFISR